MEIYALLESLEDMLENGKKVPFSEKCIVNKSELLKLIQEIYLNLPDELKQAKWIKEERERIIAEAQKDADDIVKEAENRIIAMIDEHEITRQACKKRDEIIANANEMHREYKRDANNYADSKLGEVEQKMMELGQTLSNVGETINAILETIQNDRKELK